MKYSIEHTRETGARYWGRPGRSRLAIVMLCAAQAAWGSEAAAADYDAPLIGRMVVAATRLRASSAIADLGSMTVLASREPATRGDDMRLARTERAGKSWPQYLIARNGI
jgi:hypothetical protein